MEKNWTPRQLEVKQHFIDARGAWKWSAMWDTILELDAEIVDAYADYSSVAEKREVLPIKMRKLICVAIDSVTGCLNANGLKNHMKHSLQLGISVREILETLEITSMVGACCYELGLPLLMDSMQSRGYGSGKRSAFSIYSFVKRDRLTVCLMVLLMAGILAAVLRGGTRASYTPELLVSGYDDPWLWIGSICWFVFLSIPVAVDVVEEMRWHVLRSKI